MVQSGVTHTEREWERMWGLLIVAGLGFVVWTGSMVYVISVGISDWWAYRKEAM